MGYTKDNVLVKQWLAAVYAACTVDFPYRIVFKKPSIEDKKNGESSS
jgi:hypothetical protein